jgi:pilus assembly protein CpaB
LEYRLASSDIKTGGIAAVVKEGMRAVSVAGNKVAGIAGLINPGNRVDVLVTTNDPKTEIETTKLVLDNVLVLAAGTQMREDPEGKPSPVDVFTLEVTPIQAEQLAIVANQGNLQFALRNMLDAETVLTEGATIEEALALLRGPEVEIDIPKPKPAEPAAPPPVVKKRVVRRTAPVKKSVVVEIIRGDQVGRQTF